MRIGIIADDLTGANATGVKLKKQGFSSLTLTSYKQIPSTGGHNAVIVDTDSRYVSPEEAKARIKVAFDNFMKWQADILCKRIDSTARGNIGYELDALLESIGDDSIGVIVVSYPDSGRITSGGYLLVNGAPLQTTDVAKDPVNPLNKSYIPDIIQRQSNFNVAHIALETVLEGETLLKQEMLRKIEEGHRIIVLDAERSANLPSLSKALMPILIPIVLIFLNTTLASLELTDGFYGILIFLGKPIIAVTIGLLIAIYTLTNKMSRQETLEKMEEGIQTAGIILLVTGAGGAFGYVLRESGAGDFIAGEIAAMAIPAVLIPFFIATFVRLIQGSGTVAMVTAASISAPILMAMDVNLALAAIAAAMGSLVFSYFNDSLFWVVNRLLGVKEVKEQILVWSVPTTICWAVGLVSLLIANAIF